MRSNLQRAADLRLGRAIRGRRRERGLTLMQVAGASELSQPFLSQLELGHTRPSMRSLYRIAEALGTTQQALLGQADAGDTVPTNADPTAGGARLLRHGPHGTDVTEFVGAPQTFAEYFCHDRHELLYVVRGEVELELREHGHSRLERLRACDSVGYSGGVEHRFRQIGTEECVLLVIHSDE